MKNGEMERSVGAKLFVPKQLNCRYIGSVGQRVRGMRKLTHFVRPRNTVRSPNFATFAVSEYTDFVSNHI